MLVNKVKWASRDAVHSDEPNVIFFWPEEPEMYEKGGMWELPEGVPDEDYFCFDLPIEAVREMGLTLAPGQKLPIRLVIEQRAEQLGIPFEGVSHED